MTNHMTDTPETAAQGGHVLYVTSDPDAPNIIKDGRENLRRSSQCPPDSNPTNP
jgi:hypothetical protein